MAIHKDFADWYRAASVTPSAELLEARWKGVEAAAADLDASGLVTLLKLHAVPPQAGYKAPEFLDAAFRAQDTTFPNRNNTEELRILSGAIVRRTMETDGSLAISAALGLVSSSFGSRRQTVSTPDHIRSAEEYVARKGASVRDIGAEPKLEIEPMRKEDFDELMPTSMFATNQVPQLRDPLFNTFNDESARLSSNLVPFGAAIWRTVQVQREELNMLWWLQTKVSRDLRIPFFEFNERQATIVLPKELAELTVFVPGPPAILGMILASLEVARTDGAGMSVAAAVNSTPRAWREKFSAAQAPLGLGDLCPVSLAIAKSLDTDGEMDWLPVYRKQCDVKIDQDVARTELATQVYTECLFSNSLSRMMK
jgi:GTPase-associated system helical domain